MDATNTAPAAPDEDPSGATGAETNHDRNHSTTLAAEVRAAHARGWALTPLSGKRPTRPGWQREAPLPLDDLLRHVATGGNIGLRTGAVSGVLVVDFDDCDTLPTGTPSTPTVRTARGWHVYLRHVEGSGNRAGLRIDGCKADLRGDGGQVVLPGSTHPETGVIYEWHTRAEDAPMADVPPAWLAILAETPAPPVAGPAAPVVASDRFGAAALRAEAEGVRTAPEGTRNATLNRAAYKLAGYIQDGHIDEADIRAGLQEAAREAGLSDAESNATLESAIREGRKKPRKVEGRRRSSGGEGPRPPRGGVGAAGNDEGQPILNPDPTDYAMDFLCVHRHSGHPTLRRAEGQWWLWTGTHYAPLHDESLGGMVRRHFYGRQYWKLKPGQQDLKVAAPIKTDCNLVREVGAALPACDGVLVSEPAPCWLDGAVPPRPDARLIPVANGLLDFERRALHPHDPRYFERFALPFAYDRHAPEPRAWMDFLHSLWGHDAESVQLLQEWIGYVVSGDTRHHKILAIVGPPRSGKSTVARILAALVGEANVANPTLGSLATNFGPAALLGKPLVIIPDARLGRHIDTATVTERLLSISGGDPQQIDRKYRDPIPDVRLICRFVLVSNELPALADASGALASRFLILQTRASYLGREDLGLLPRLLAELPGIFKWALVGAERLQLRGRFLQPESATEAVLLLRDITSPVAQFVDEEYERDPQGTVPKDEVRKAWKRWCEAQGRAPGNQAHLGRDLKALGIEGERPRLAGCRVNCYRGIKRPAWREGGPGASYYEC